MPWSDDIGWQGRVVSGEATTSSLTWYLDRIGRVPLRTAEQEVDLAKRAQAGMAAAAALAGSAADGCRVRLERIVREGARASALLTEANLRLVVAMANRYRGRGLDLSDLVQEGNLGLLTAVRRFDPARGFRFSTYASWWIRQAILTGLATRARTVRLPVHAYEIAARLRATEIEVFQRTGREPTEEELAERLGVRVDRVREIRRASRQIVSLDAPLTRDGGGPIGSHVPDPDAEDPAARVGEAAARELLHDVLERLSEREREVLVLRYGLADGRPRTLEQVGAHLRVTRERVRQIERRALRKLAHPRLDGLLGSEAR